MEKLFDYKELVFTKRQLFLDRSECAEIAEDFFGKTNLSEGQFTDRDRAFIQGALLIAVEASKKTGMIFDLFSSFISAAPSKSVQKIVGSLANKVAKRWLSKIIDNTPKISAVGKAAVQVKYSTTWKTRVQTGDVSFLPNFLAAE